MFHIALNNLYNTRIIYVFKFKIILPRSNGWYIRLGVRMPEFQLGLPLNFL